MLDKHRLLQENACRLRIQSQSKAPLGGWGQHRSNHLYRGCFYQRLLLVVRSIPIFLVVPSSSSLQSAVVTRWLIKLRNLVDLWIIRVSSSCGQSASFMDVMLEARAALIPASTFCENWRTPGKDPVNHVSVGVLVISKWASRWEDF